MSYTGSLFNFINNSTSSFHTVLNAQSYLIKNGFEEVNFSEDWQLKADKKYFTKIYDSTLIAFIPHQNLREGMKIAVSHTDFPCLKIKPSADIMQNDYGKLNVEVYGGMILNTWFDRPLSIAGKVVLKGQDCYQPDVKFVDFKRPLMIIPNLAIHMDRSINSGKSISKQRNVAFSFYAN
jgi:aspartyl aminopeptidase